MYYNWYINVHNRNLQLESTIGIFNVECYFLVKVYIYIYDVYSL